MIEGSPTLIRSAWVVSLPIIFLEVAEKLLYVTDTALLTRVGTTEVAALALADTIVKSWLVVAVGLVGGLLIFLGRRFGERRDRAVGQTFHTGLLLVVLTSLVLTGALKLASPFLSEYAATSYDVAANMDVYLQLAAYGIVFLSIDLAFASLYVSLGRTRVLIVASALLVLINLALSYVLIFGKLGLPRLGMEGAALGDLGAEFVTCVFLTVYTLRQRDLRRYGLFRLESWDTKLAWSLLRTSSPISLQALLEGLRWFFFFVIVEQISTEALAWSNIIYASYEVIMIPTMAFSVAAYSMVSNLIGEAPAQDIERTVQTGGGDGVSGDRFLSPDRPGGLRASEEWQEKPVPSRVNRTSRTQVLLDRIGRLIRTLTLSVYLMTLPLVVFGLLFPNVVLSVFTSDQATIEGAAHGLRLVLLAMLLVVPSELWVAAVAGTGDTDAALVIEFFLTVAVLVTAYIAVLVVFTASLTYVWLSLPIGGLICLLLSYAWVRSGYWERVRI